MPRSFGRVHEEQVKFELRAERAFLRSVEKVRERLLINDVAMAVSSGSISQASRLLSQEAVEDPLGPLALLIEDAFTKGGRIGAATVKAALKEGQQ